MVVVGNEEFLSLLQFIDQCSSPPFSPPALSSSIIHLGLPSPLWSSLLEHHKCSSRVVSSFSASCLSDYRGQGFKHDKHKPYCETSVFWFGAFRELNFLFELFSELAHLLLLSIFQKDSFPLLRCVLLLGRFYLYDGRAQGISQSLHGCVLRELVSVLFHTAAALYKKAVLNCTRANPLKMETYLSFKSSHIGCTQKLGSSFSSYFNAQSTRLASFFNAIL